MNYRRGFEPQFKKDGTPKKGYSDWGERLENIKMRRDGSKCELDEGKTFFRGEYFTLKCVHCGNNTVKKIYMLDKNHYAKYECTQCYRNLQWVSKPKVVNWNE